MEEGVCLIKRISVFGWEGVVGWGNSMLRVCGISDGDDEVFVFVI